MSLAFALTNLDPEEFRERRLAARRSGTPTWLWPEVSLAEWTIAMREISRAAALLLAGEAAQLQGENLKVLSLACYTSGIGPWLGWWRERGLLSASDKASELLALHLTQARERSEAVAKQSLSVVGALQAKGLRVVVLKGGCTGFSFFPEPATRPSSDLDLLVPHDCGLEAEAALSEAGLECRERNAEESSWAFRGMPLEPHSLWLLCANDPWSVDLHRTLDFSAVPGAERVRFDSAEPFASNDPWPLDGRGCVLRQPLLLLHLAVHASGGLHSLTLLRMIEIVLVIRQDIASARLSWDDFLAAGARIKALGAAYPALAMAEQLAPSTIPSGVLRICGELAPARVRRVVEKLEPATAQRIDRASIAEHFMWTSGVRSWARQLSADLAPTRQGDQSPWSVYKSRAYRLLRGRITR